MVGLSIGELAEVVGATSGVVLFGVGGVEYRLRAVKRRLDERERAADREHERHEMLVVVVERGLAGTITAVDGVGGQLQRIMEERTHEITTEELLETLGKLVDGVRLPWLEARTMMDDIGVQLSALQQLVQRLGDSDTQALLEKAADVGSDGHEEAGRLRRAADAIGKRIEKSDESADGL